MISISVTIQTHCKIGDVILNSYLIADRNVGTPPRWDTEGNVIPARNYTNDSLVVISGMSGNYVSDRITNAEFKGDFANFGQANDAIQIVSCPSFGKTHAKEGDKYYDPKYASSWKQPDGTLMTTISKNMFLSKQRAILLQPTKDGDWYIGCFFPFSGYGSYLNNISGSYWSTTKGSGIYGTYLSLKPTSISVPSSGWATSDKSSVRCYRSI